MAYLIVVPVILIVAPRIERFVSYLLTEKVGEQKKAGDFNSKMKFY